MRKCILARIDGSFAWIPAKARPSHVVCALLCPATMMKSVLSASLLLTLLCGPAFAGSVPVTYAIDLATKTEHHTLFVADRSCGEIQLKSRDRESFFRVCASTSDGNYVRLDIDRRTREKEDEARTSAVVVAAPGASYDLLDTKLTVKTK